jgi:hypothetical protein
MRRISSRTSRVIVGRPARRRYVQRLATKRRRQRSSVAGVTMKDVQMVRGSNRLAVAKNARSAIVSGGRRVRRRKMANSCRSTTISSSLNSRERNRRTISCNTR